MWDNYRVKKKKEVSLNFVEKSGVFKKQNYQSAVNINIQKKYIYLFD